jgi:hypothetical protein
MSSTEYIKTKIVCEKVPNFELVRLLLDSIHRLYANIRTLQP